MLAGGGDNPAAPACDGSADSTESDEGKDGYKRGGYHPVYVGEVYNDRYVVLRKLGWGHFSTVWMVFDKKLGNSVALKVQKSAKHYTEAAQDEIEILEHLKSRNTSGEDKAVVQVAPSTTSANGELFCRCKFPLALRWSCVRLPATFLVLCQCTPRQLLTTTTIATMYAHQLLDQFYHRGPHGMHMCMVFEIMGENLLSLIKYFEYNGADRVDEWSASGNLE